MPVSGLSRGAIGVALEQAIRPFVERGPRPVPVRETPAQPPAEAEISWSARMSVQVTTLEAQGIRVIWPDSEDHREVARQTRTVRVQNPSDPSQFVDVEDIQTIDFRSRGRRSRFRLRS